jgi:hypothetical protein
MATQNTEQVVSTSADKDNRVVLFELTAALLDAKRDIECMLEQVSDISRTMRESEESDGYIKNRAAVFKMRSVIGWIEDSVGIAYGALKNLK